MLPRLGREETLFGVSFRNIDLSDERMCRLINLLKAELTEVLICRC
jgi:hypothetical protein